MSTQADVLIITVTKVESEAVFQMFQEVTGRAPTPKSVGDRTYHDLGVINGASAFMAQSEMGSGGVGASLLTVKKGIDALSPRAVIMVGIAFGVDAEKQSIGDILVSTQISLYELQRVGTDKGKDKIIPRGDKPHASSRLLNSFRSGDLYWKNGPPVRFGLILSGEKLVDNMDFRHQLREIEPEAIGGEMEGAGLYVACEASKVDWILVKAICDWADGEKAKDKDQCQEVAARNAASFVLYVLKQITLESVFSGSISVLEKLADAAINPKDIPEQQRKRYQDAVTESYLHLNSAVNLVFLRLGDLLSMNKARFLNDLQQLDNDKKWLTLERNVRLCSNLRTTHLEMDDFLSRMTQFSPQDWDKARLLVDQILEREGTLADFISSSLERLAQMAPKARESADEYKKVRETVAQVRETVREERVRLMKSEVAFLDAISGRRDSA